MDTSIEEILDDTRRVNTTAKARLTEAEAEAALLQERLTRSEEEILQLRERRDTLEDAVRVGAEEVRSVTYARDAAVAEANGLRCRTDELTARMTDAEYEAASLHDTLTAERAAARHNAADLLDATKRITSADTAAEHSEHEIAHLRARLETAEVAEEALRGRHDDRQERLAGVEDEIADLRGEVQVLRKEKTRMLEKHAAEVDRLETVCAEWEASAARSAAELTALRSELQPTLRRACKERDELHLEKVTWERERARTSESLVQLEALSSELRDDRDHLRRSLHATEFEAEQQKDDISRLQRKLEEVLTNKQQGVRKVANPAEDAAAQRIQSLVRSRNARREVDRRRTRQHRADLAAVRIQSCVRQRNAAKEVAARRKAAQDARLAEVEDALQSRESALQTVVSQFEECSQKLAECRADLDGCEGREAVLRRERHEMFRKAEELTSRADEAELNADLANSAVERLREDMRRLEEQLRQQTQLAQAAQSNATVNTAVRQIAAASPSPQRDISALRTAVGELGRAADELRGDDVHEFATTPRHREIGYLTQSGQEAVRHVSQQREVEKEREYRDVNAESPSMSVGMLEKAAATALREMRTQERGAVTHNTEAVLSMLSSAVSKTRSSRPADPSRAYDTSNRHDAPPYATSHTDVPYAAASHTDVPDRSNNSSPILQEPWVSPPRQRQGSSSQQSGGGGGGGGVAGTRYVSPDKVSVASTSEGIIRGYHSVAAYDVPIKRRQSGDRAALEQYEGRVGGGGGGGGDVGGVPEVRAQPRTPTASSYAQHAFAYDPPRGSARYNTPSSRRGPLGPPAASTARNYATVLFDYFWG